MQVRRTENLVLHLVVVPSIVYHVWEKVIWPVAGWGVAAFAVPLFAIAFLKGKLKKAYAAFLVYAYATLPLYYATWVWGVVKYALEPSMGPGLVLSLITALNFLIKRNATSLCLFACALSGLSLSFHFSFVTLWLHYFCVTSFFIVLFYRDLHVVLFPINFVLKVRRIANRVV